jgi:NADH-quinone oxidoreductase subunit L
MAGTIGLVQNDIKRVLAYSTVSQLGYMFLAMGVGAYSAGIFHLYTHAFFKALLFLGSGAVIHALHGEQDIRRMGGLRKQLPITFWTFLIGALAISGVPGLAGFFSKDKILEEAFTSGHRVLWAVGLLTAALTATYMFRLVYLTFCGESRASSPEAPSHPVPASPVSAHPAPHEASSHPAPGSFHDAPPAMAFALIVLAVGSVVAGYVGLGGWFEHFLEPSFSGRVVEVPVDASGELTLTAVSVLAAAGGILLATYFFLKDRSASDKVAEQFAGPYRVLLNKYYVDEIYDAAVVQPIAIVSEDVLWKTIDVRVIDGAVNGVADAVGAWSQVVRRLQTGSVRAYAASLFVGVVAILGYYLWK